jgi:hypothetical protein
MGPFTRMLMAHPALTRRRKQTARLVGRVRGQLKVHAALRSRHLTVFTAGSLGREEAGKRSDLDLFVLGEPVRRGRRSRALGRLDEYEIFAALIEGNRRLGFPRFSGDGRYLKVYSIEDMKRATGSPRDDSENLFTARMLLLLESKPLINDRLYHRAITQTTRNYFRDDSGKRDYRPLFLLNDILRYWRTLCLNYEELRHDRTRSWFRKNINLKFARRLTIFSTVLAFLSGRIATAGHFIELCELTPLERLAQALDDLGDTKLTAAFVQLLDDYEMFLGAKERGIEGLATPPAIKRRLKTAANRLGRFLYDCVMSPSADGRLRPFVVI